MFAIHQLERLDRGDTARTFHRRAIRWRQKSLRTCYLESCPPQDLSLSALGFDPLLIECERDLVEFGGQGIGVSDGARTRDIPDHNRVLYQLSYAHHDCAPTGYRFPIGTARF